ncbi:MAG: 3-dehydroquinate synthase II [Conexivisphaerales archaeon]
MKKVIVKLPPEKVQAEKITLAASGYSISDFIGANNGLDESSIKTFTISSGEDVEKIKKAVESGVKSIRIETSDWRVIPLENIISWVSGKAALYAEARNIEDAIMLGGVLEKGIDGIIVSPKDVDEMASYADALGIGRSAVKLVEAQVESIKVVGNGSRACVDTAEMLREGEGMLVGSFSSFLFLVHAEVFGSKYTSPRPFRVNAGAVNSYILAYADRTKYLSELSAGDKVMVVDKAGNSRVVVVGRSKVERRPLVLITAKASGQNGAVLLQYAETVSLVSGDGNIRAVTEIKPGDVVKAMVSEQKGRHFGTAVDEDIRES